MFMTTTQVSLGPNFKRIESSESGCSCNYAIIFNLNMIKITCTYVINPF